MRNDAWDERMARYEALKKDENYIYHRFVSPPLNGHPNWSDYLEPKAIMQILRNRRLHRVMNHMTDADLELLEEKYGLPPIVDDEKDRTWKSTPTGIYKDEI